MSRFKKGDTVYFSSVARLVNEGTVELIEGPYIKVKSKVPGLDYMMESEVFPSKEELRASSAYNKAWSSQYERMQANNILTNMGSMAIF